MIEARLAVLSLAAAQAMPMIKAIPDLSELQDMTVQTALTFVDDQIYFTTGRRLNDLERHVFIGSWQGQTYEQIYPFNPQYVEKSVGYKLWRKLSTALGEKVSKKRVRGVVIRHYTDALKTDALKTNVPSLPAADVESKAALSIMICQNDVCQGEFPSDRHLLVQDLTRFLEASGHQVFDPAKPGGASRGEASEADQFDYIICIRAIRDRSGQKKPPVCPVVKLLDLSV